LKLQDLGKIRFAWYHDPRVPIAAPAKLFELPEENGLYALAFGSGGESSDVWTDKEFRECLLAIHAYNEMFTQLKRLQEMEPDLKQISRL
jgi:hypothetical protein